MYRRVVETVEWYLVAEKIYVLTQNQTHINKVSDIRDTSDTRGLAWKRSKRHDGARVRPWARLVLVFLVSLPPSSHLSHEHLLHHRVHLLHLLQKLRRIHARAETACTAALAVRPRARVWRLRPSVKRF